MNCLVVTARYVGQKRTCAYHTFDDRRRAEAVFALLLREAEEMRDLGELSLPLVVELRRGAEVILRRTIRDRVTRKAEQPEGRGRGVRA